MISDMTTFWIVMIIEIVALSYGALRLVAWVQGTPEPGKWRPKSLHPHR